MAQITGFVTVAEFKDFWPLVCSIFPADRLDKEIAFYIKRAEILVNRLGVYEESRENFDADMEMATQLLIQRLVQKDKHPASSGDAAGVTSEAARGVSYSKNKTRDFAGLLGEEIYSMLRGLLDEEFVTGVITTEVFPDPVILIEEADGTLVKKFDLATDDDLRRQTNPIVPLFDKTENV